MNRIQLRDGFELDGYEALTVLHVLIKAFQDLPADPPPLLMVGALLLFDSVRALIHPALPLDSDDATARVILDHCAEAREIADNARIRLGLYRAS